MRQVVLLVLLLISAYTGCSNVPNKNQVMVSFGNGDTAILAEIEPLNDNVFGCLPGPPITESMTREEIDANLANRPGCYVWDDGSEYLDIQVLGPGNQPFFSDSPQGVCGLKPAVVNMIGENGLQILWLEEQIEPTSKGKWRLAATGDTVCWALIPGTKDGGLLLIFKR